MLIILPLADSRLQYKQIQFSNQTFIKHFQRKCLQTESLAQKVDFDIYIHIFNEDLYHDKLFTKKEQKESLCNKMGK